jgi:hypothetical protein
MANVPDDLLIYISTFLTSFYIAKLLSVSRTFFHLAMDARYREIAFGSPWDPKEMRLMRRLQCVLTFLFINPFLNLAQRRPNDLS